jgi:hypothetical protein
MSFLDSLKQDALAVFHATANALHAQLANGLAQAGHSVSEDDHVDTLVQTAAAASTNSGAPAAVASTTAPNYADNLLATFVQSMTAASVAFAQAHLPAKFQGVASDAAQAVTSVLADGKVTAGEAVSAAANVAAAAVSAVAPGAAPVAAIVSNIVDAVASGASSASDVAATVEQTAVPVAAAAISAGVNIAETEADKVAPGLGAVVGALASVGESVLTGKSDTTPAANTSGV